MAGLLVDGDVDGGGAAGGVAPAASSWAYGSRCSEDTRLAQWAPLVIFSVEPLVDAL